MTSRLNNRYHLIFSAAALGVWIALGWPFLHELATGEIRRALPVPLLWLLPYALFGATILAGALLKPGTGLRWILPCVQLAAVVAMTIVRPSGLMSLFLIVIAWQVAAATSPARALAWIGFQTAAVIGIIAATPNPDFSYILVLSLVLQLCCVLTAQTLHREAEAARALGRTNRELQAAQAIIADNVRDAERLRISRELHDAWGHELTALGLQLEIASHVGERERANDHVMRAKGLSRALLAKVRDVVAALREAESGREDGRTGADGDAGTAAGAASAPFAAPGAGNRRQWSFCIAAFAVTLALAYPVFKTFVSGGAAPSLPWLGAFFSFAAALLAAMVLKPRPAVQWALLGVQVAAVVAMAFIASWAMMAAFLIVVAWQVALLTGPVKALAWVGLQSLLVTGALALAPRPDLCWVLGKAVALQLFFVFTAQAVRREAETVRALAQRNRELRAAQAIIANNARDAERLRISRELHDAWGHELTALGLQLEIASHVGESARAADHVLQAKGLARSLLGKVRDVVATLREAEPCDLKDALEALARSVPRPAVHVAIAPGVRVSPDQAHALMRCAQEAVTNAVRHSEAANLWLEVSEESDGVRLVARNDGKARRAAAAAAPGSGLVGMRERVESLGGRLAVRTGMNLGFAVEAWLPLRTRQAA